jgi:mono/diheme cytochrome c family protein
VNLSAPPKRQRQFLAAFVIGVCATPIVGLAFGLSGFMPINSVGKPPEWESRIGQIALEASLSRRSHGFVNAINENDADLAAGMNTYRRGCAGCHGDYGEHRSGLGLYPPPPQFSEHPPALTAPEMFVVVKYGVRYTGMAANNDDITDEKIWQTVSFLSRLSNLPSSVNEAWKAKHE